MSTISSTDLTITDANVTNLKDASGNNGSTPLQISSGRAKIWATFDGTGTPAVTAQGGSSATGISSITDNTTGDYTFNFSPALTDVNWCGLTLGGGGSAYSQRGYEDATARTTSTWRTYWVDHVGTPQDTPNNNIAIFGN